MFTILVSFCRCVYAPHFGLLLYWEHAPFCFAVVFGTLHYSFYISNIYFRKTPGSWKWKQQHFVIFHLAPLCSIHCNFICESAGSVILWMMPSTPTRHHTKVCAAISIRGHTSYSLISHSLAHAGAFLLGETKKGLYGSLNVIQRIYYDIHNLEAMLHFYLNKGLDAGCIDVFQFNCPLNSNWFQLSSIWPSSTLSSLTQTIFCYCHK